MKLRELDAKLTALAECRARLATAHKEMDRIGHRLYEDQRRNRHGYIDHCERELERLLDEEIDLG